jgi:replicative DNA helicase
LKNPNKLVELQETEISPEYFLVDANKYIYSAMNYLFSKKLNPTPLAIMEVFVDKHAKLKVEEFGGLDYLLLLTESQIDESNLPIFVQKLKQAYTRYELYKICNNTQSHIFSDSMEVLNPHEIINQHEIEVAKLASNVQQVSEAYKMGDDAEEILARRAEHPNEIPGLETGWDKFDYYTNGGRPGDLIMVSARSKTGKSVLLTNWATKMGIIDKIPVLYIDTEMNEREQEDRILSMLTDIPHKELVSGMHVLDTEYGTAVAKQEKLKNAIKLLKEGNYYHIYMPNFTLEKVSAITTKFYMQYGIQALFFDYLKFPSNMMSSLKAAAEWQMLGFFASGLKDLGGILKIPVYSACQENRSNLDGSKDARNIGGSDRILHMATTLCFLYNKTDEQIMKDGRTNGNQQLYIAYQRNGQSEVPPINIDFQKHILKQVECR